MSQRQCGEATKSRPPGDKHDTPRVTPKQKLAARRAAQAAERREQSESEVLKEGNTFVRKCDYETQSITVRVHERSVKPVLLMGQAVVYYNLGKFPDVYKVFRDEMPVLDDYPKGGEPLAGLSDRKPTGNGQPCKFYNRGKCINGHACLLSHAPDNWSERDALGRNVCKYYLMDACKSSGKCAYLHSKDCLLQKGWWSTPEGISKAKRIHKVQKPFKKAVAERKKQDKPSMKPETGSASKKKKRSGGKKKRKQPVTSNSKPKCTVFLASPHGYDSDDGNKERAMLRFTNDDDVEELLFHGVKPWDSDARDFLDALHEGYRKIDDLEKEREKRKRDRRAPRGSGPEVDPVAGKSQSISDVSARASQKKSAKARKRSYGFTESEVEELMCYGVKPWEDDARGFLGRCV